jgi:hypothetical protein
MCILHHTPHKPPSHIPHPTLPHNIEHNVKRGVPRALLQPLMPQTRGKDSSAALPHAEPCERAAPNIREETRVYGSSRARAVYGAAAPRTPTEAGRQRAGVSSHDSEEEGMREDWSVYCALADLGMEERVKGGWYVCVCVCVLHALGYRLIVLRSCRRSRHFSPRVARCGA